jgi:hemerythrin superfamily protein
LLLRPQRNICHRNGTSARLSDALSTAARDARRLEGSDVSAFCFSQAASQEPRFEHSSSKGNRISTLIPHPPSNASAPGREPTDKENLMPTTNTQATDAIELLTTDHETVRRLLHELGDSTSDQLTKRTDLVTGISQAIRVHARIEEEIFYPAYHAAAETPDDTKLFFEAAEEHGLVDVVLPGLEDEDPSTEVFAAKAKVLKDLIEHHAEEEETLMFPRAVKLLGKERLLELGAAMEALRQRLVTEMRPG